MTPEHLAAHYVGELANIGRITARANNTRNNRDLVAAQIATTERDDDPYLAALAREYRRLNARLVHDDERVTAQKHRLAAIGHDLALMAQPTLDRFWTEADRLHGEPAPLWPLDGIAGRTVVTFLSRVAS